jgi:hypothetical protein
MVGKSRTVGIMTGDGTDGSLPSGPYTFSKINFDFGIPGFRQISQIGQRVAYLTPQGVASFDMGAGPYSVYFTQAKMTYQYLSEAVRNQLNNLALTNEANALCWHDWQQTRISFAVTESGQSYNNVIWHYDYPLNCWYKTRPAHHIVSAFVDTDGTVYTGDENGNIYQWNSTQTSFNGQPINAFYKTPYLDFGDPNLLKQINWIRFTGRAQGTYSLTVSPFFDYGLRIGQPETLPLSVGNYVWGGGVWTTNATTYQWGGSPIQIERIYPSGYFHNIQLNLSINGTDTPLDILELEFSVTFDDDR